MSEASHWKEGDVIVFRGVGHKKIWYALPVFVVQDTRNLVAVYWPAGTHAKVRMKSTGERVTPVDAIRTPMELIDYTWKRTDVLMLITPEAAHAVYVMWEEGHRNFLCWYVNLQDPICRTPIGFDTRDHVLDIVINPDRSSWHWKDEEDLEDAVAVGLFSGEEASKIRAEGERVISLLRENRPPFCDGWEKWSPPSHWGIAQLAGTWNSGFS